MWLGSPRELESISILGPGEKRREGSEVDEMGDSHISHGSKTENEFSRKNRETGKTGQSEKSATKSASPKSRGLFEGIRKRVLQAKIRDRGLEGCAKQ